MLLKLLPGFIVALILAICFCLVRGDASPTRGEPTSRLRVAPPVPVPDLSAGGRQPELFVLPWDEQSFRREGMPLPAPEADVSPRGRLTDPAIHSQLVADGPRVAFVPEGVSAMAAPVLPQPEPSGTAAKTKISPADDPTSPNIGRIRLLPNRSASSGGALPNLIVDGCPENAETPRWSDRRDRGMEIFASVVGFDEKQKQRDLEQSFYKQSGSKYSVGFLYDWSIDSTLGLSLDIVESEVKSRQYGDRIKNDVDAYILNANYEGTLLGKYPMRGSVFYGRVDNSGSGEIDDIGTGIATPTAWREDKFRSNLYGLSGQIGLPLVYGDEIKVQPEIGFRYTRLKGKSHNVHVANAARELRFPGHDAKSLIIPVTLTTKKDFQQSWGVITPKMFGGAFLELEKSATGVRTFNSAAASKIYYDAITSTIAYPEFDDSQKVFFQIGVGIGVKINNGWEIAAEYQRLQAEKYTNNAFRLELVRCF